MDDLVRRLRDQKILTGFCYSGQKPDSVCMEAADRIEALEKALLYIIDEWADEYETGGLENFCRAALGEKKDV